LAYNHFKNEHTWKKWAWCKFFKLSTWNMNQHVHSKVAKKAYCNRNGCWKTSN
jgi:hypothetical protein